MRLAIVAAVMLGLASCGTGSSDGPIASVPRTAIPTTAPAATASPTSAAFASQLNCAKPVTATHGLALYEDYTASVLRVLDVSDPLKPALLCSLSPAMGGRFVQSPAQIAFWIGNKLGTADLTSGKVVQTDTLSLLPSEGFFSSDGAQFAYRTGDDSVAGMSLQLYRRGDHADLTLYTQNPLGGHGGPPNVPVDQLVFSPDNKLLLDYYVFRPMSGIPPRFIVFKTSDTSIAYQLETGAFGAWAATGSTVYFFVQGEQGFIGELDSVGISGQAQTVVGAINGFLWPRATPDGAGIVYDTFDDAGLPHIWRFDLTTHAVAQLSGATSSQPVFVTRTVLWAAEEKPCDCGMGGQSAQDGVVLAHNLSGGAVTPVDMSRVAPGAGAPQASPSGIVDVWY